MEDNNLPENDQPNLENEIHDVIPVSGMYENWFMDYASYVILERAVPAIEDGLKPVQRRILHAMKEMDDGRFNKVANIIGSTMQYHPHGDASIGDAIVNMGQKDLLIETQGNWGDIRTGDGAAAPRYIEARLSKFALDILFNAQTTQWQLSYDGRKREPITLPAKFPLLLAQGVEGIAVGLSTKILPHNFIELIEASIAYLKGRKFTLYPDFATGGLIDVSDYNDGERGGKVRVRAKIEEYDKKTLIIKDIPFGTNTTGLIESIIKANDKGKIKIKKVIDNTAKDVEVLVSLAPGVSPDITIDALYAFTDCEVSISPNACVIVEDKPRFMSVSDILKICSDQTKDLLERELQIRKGELMERMLFSSLEKIFIENRIYRDIEECETWEAVLTTIDEGLEPYKPQFYRVITQDDIVKLTEIKIKRISKFDAFKADELMRRLQEELEEVEYNLANLVEYAVKYYQTLLTKYGKGRERCTEIAAFDTISAAVVAANNAKLYVNKTDGFIGYGLKKDEFVCDCSDIDDIVVLRKDGVCVVSRIQEKVFVGKDILHVDVWRKADDRTTYNMAYVDGKTGVTRVKRFQVTAITRDKEYDLTAGNKGSKVLYLTANPNGEAETITVSLTAGAKARNKIFDFDFRDVEIRGRGTQGITLTKYPIRKIAFKAAGVSTLGGLNIWYDTSVGRLNTDQRGKYIGNFLGNDQILTITTDGIYELTTFELTNRYDANGTMVIEKFDQERIVSVLYYDGGNKNHYIKRFKIETTTLNKTFKFISEEKGSKLVFVSTHPEPKILVKFTDKGKNAEQEFDINEMIDIKGWRANGNRFPIEKIKSVSLISEDEPAMPKSGAKKEEFIDLEDLKAQIAEEISHEEEEKTGFTPGTKIDLDIKKKDPDEKDQLGLFE